MSKRFERFLTSLGFTDEGWITADGKFWPCDKHMQHGFVAGFLLKSPEADAEKEADKRRWLRISDYGNRIAARSLTQKQRDTLFDYCEFHGCDFKEVVGSIRFLQ